MQIQLAADAAVLESAMPRSVGRGAPRGSYRNGVAPSNGYRPRGGSRGGRGDYNIYFVTFNWSYFIYFLLLDIYFVL